MKRFLSDGDFLHESCTPLSAMSSKHESMPHKGFSAPLQRMSHLIYQFLMMYHYRGLLLFLLHILLSGVKIIIFLSLRDTV